MPARIVLIAVWVFMLLSVGAAMLVASLPPAPWKGPVIMALAVFETALVAWFYMHLDSAPGLVRLFAAGIVLWLMIMFGLALPDYFTR